MDLKTEALKIYKYNPLIKGRIIGQLTENDFLLNEIFLRLAQKEMRQQLFCPFQPLNFHIHMPELKKMLYEKDKVPLRWRRDIKNSLTRLRNLTIEIKNYEIPDETFLEEEDYILSSNKEIKTQKIEYACFGLVEEPEIIDDVLYWRYSKYMVFWAWYKKNYTHLNIYDIRKMNSKYAQRLYEYIEYYKNLNAKRNNIADTITLGRQEFESIINLSNTSVGVLFQKIHLNLTLRELRKIYPNIEISSPPRSNIIEIKNI